jgi:hypothetical protein
LRQLIQNNHKIRLQTDLVYELQPDFFFIF